MFWIVLLLFSPGSASFCFPQKLAGQLRQPGDWGDSLLFGAEVVEKNNGQAKAGNQSWQSNFAKQAKSSVKKDEKSIRAVSSLDASSGFQPGRQFKRNSDEQIARAIKTKLGMFPKQQVDMNLGDNGQLIAAKVKMQLQKRVGTRKHIPLQFWQDLIGEHRLCGSVAQTLPCPQVEEPVGRELDAGLKLCHASNPAAKSSARLTRLLSYVSSLNETEFYGLLRYHFQPLHFQNL